MANKIMTTLFTLFVITLTTLSIGCGGGAATSDDTANAPKVEMTIKKIIILSQVGKTSSPGGYYSLIRLNLANNTKSELEVKLKDFSIKEKLAKGDDAYVISPENIPGYIYAQEFGAGTEPYELIDKVSVKPKFEFTKDIFFMLPNSADITDYELLHETDELKFDLEESELEDRRTE